MSNRSIPLRAAPGQPAPVALSPPSRHGRIGPVGVGQLVALQLAAVLVAVTYPVTDWVFIPAVLLALGGCAAAFARRDGRWWYRDAAVRWRLRRRPAAGPAASLVVQPYLSRGTRIGIGRDDRGWFAAGEVTAADSTPAPGLDRILQVVVGRMVAVPGLPASTVQVVAHRTEAGATVRWVAVRVAAVDAPGWARQRGGGEDGVKRSLTAAMGVLGGGLGEAGWRLRVLDPDELRAAVWTVTGRPPAPEQLPAVGERWAAWQEPAAAHVCFRIERGRSSAIGGLPAAAAAGLTAAGVEAVTVAVVVGRPTPGGRPVHGLLQVRTAPSGQAAADELATTVERAGFRLRRWDGEHGPACYAAAPTGGELAGLDPDGVAVSGPTWRSRRRRR